MTAPSYTTDLRLITDAQSGTWAELTGYTGGSAPTVNDTDYFIQGTGCTTQSSSSKTGLSAGVAFDYGSDMKSLFGSGNCFFVWQVVLAGNACDTFANGGLYIGIGTVNGGMNMFKAGGNDFGRNPYGGWHNIAIDPTYTPVDLAIGTPGTQYRWFGSLPNYVSAISKGNLHAVDAIRWGRGNFMVRYGDSSGYATFAGMAAINDLATYRWGLFQEQAGSYLWKGLITLGSGVVPVDFRDSNRNIVVDACPRAYADFNKIEVRCVTSRVDWTSVGIQALTPNVSGTQTRGVFKVIDDADVNFDSCTFTDMSYFTFLPSSTSINTTWRRCDQVTQSGSVFTGCTFSNSRRTSTVASGALLVDAMDNVTNCIFEVTSTTASGHAVVYRPTGAGPFSVNWNGNQLTGYATVSGSTGREAILLYPVTTTATINLTVINEADIPSTMKHSSYTGVFNLIIPEITLTIEANVSLVGAEIRIYDMNTSPPDFGTELQGTESHDSVTYSYSGTAGNIIYIQIMKPGYVEFGQSTTMPEANGTYYALLEVDTND